jgi:hypothetical protein
MSLSSLNSGSGAFWANLTGDADINFEVGSTTDYGQINVVGGWWFCNAAQNRALWAHGSSGHSLNISALGELTIGINKVTTDTQWTTSSLAFPTLTWVFIATAIYTANGLTNPADVAAVLWTGTELLPPTQKTLTNNVVGSGSISISGQGNFGINCTSATSTVLSGAASQIHVHHTTADIPGSAITQTLIDQTYNLYVQPMWNGKFNPHNVHGRRADGFASFGPRTEGNNVSSTMYFPLSGRTTISSNHYWPAYLYLSSASTDIGVKLSQASTASTENFSAEEFAASRYRRITTGAQEANPLLMRV